MTSSPPALETSIATSLRDLARLEEERVHREREALARERERKAAARSEAERREAEERTAREREAERAWIERVREEREDAARIEAIQRAIAETARREAEQRAAAAERDRRAQHDVAMAAAGASRRLARLARIALVEGAALALLVGAAAWGYLAIVVPREAARATESARTIAARDAAIAALEGRIAEEERALAAARDEATNAEHRADALDADLARARGDLQKLRYGGRVSPPRVPHARGADAPSPFGDSGCDPRSHDPLCPEIAR